MVGPRNVKTHLESMLHLGGVPNVLLAADRALDLRFVEVDGSWQEAGPLQFRAIAVDHVPELDCYGFLFKRGERTIGYSGDTIPCRGLDELATEADVLVLECNGKHPPAPVPVTHMDVGDVQALRQAHPTVPFVLTHLGEEPDISHLPHTVVPNDFETVVL